MQMTNPYAGGSMPSGRAAGGRRLLVKVIKAMGLGAKQGKYNHF